MRLQTIILSGLMLISAGLAACGDDASEGGEIDGAPGGEVDGDTLVECPATLPEDVTVVGDGDDEVFNTAGGSVWVCDGGSANINISATNTEIFVEDGGTATINGSGAVIWARSGSEVTVNVSASELSEEEGANVELNASISDDRRLCSSIQLDRSAVAEPCP
jgi:hypothetical protein